MTAFSEEELEVIRGLFAQLDVETIGYLSLETLQGFLDAQGNGVSREALEAQFRDITGDCTHIRMNDFICWMAQLQGRPKPLLDAVVAGEPIREPSSTSSTRMGGRALSIITTSSNEPEKTAAPESTLAPRASRQHSDVTVTSLKLPASARSPSPRSPQASPKSPKLVGFRQRSSSPSLNSRLSTNSVPENVSSVARVSQSSAGSVKLNQARTSKLGIPPTPHFGRDEEPTRTESAPLLSRRASTPTPPCSPKPTLVRRRTMSTTALPASLEQKMVGVEVAKRREGTQTFKRVSKLVRDSIANLFDVRRKSHLSNAESTVASEIPELRGSQVSESESKRASVISAIRRTDDEDEYARLMEMKQLVLQVQRLGLPSYIADVVAESMRLQEPDPRQIQQTGDLVARLLQDRPEFEPPPPLEYSVELKQIRAQVCGRLESEVDAVQSEVKSLNELVEASWTTIATQKELINHLNSEAKALTQTTDQLQAKSSGTIDPAAMHLAAEKITAQMSLVREGTASVVKELANYAEALNAKKADPSRQQMDRDPDYTGQLNEPLDDDSVFDGTLSYTADSCFAAIAKSLEEPQPFGASLKTHIQRLRQRVTDLSASANHRSQTIIKQKKTTKRAKRTKVDERDEFCSTLKPLPVEEGATAIHDGTETKFRGSFDERDETRSVLQAALDSNGASMRSGHEIGSSLQSSAAADAADVTLRRPVASLVASSSTPPFSNLTQSLPSSLKYDASPNCTQPSPSSLKDGASSNLTQPLASSLKECRSVPVEDNGTESRQKNIAITTARATPSVDSSRRTKEPSRNLQPRRKNIGRISSKPKDMLSQLKLQTEELRAHAEKTELLRDAAVFALKSGMSLQDALCHLQGLPARPRWQQRYRQGLLQAEIPEAPTPPEAPPEEHWEHQSLSQDNLARPEHYIDSWLMSSGAPVGKSSTIEDTWKASARLAQ